MANEKEILSESEKQTRAAKARDARSQRKLAFKRQQERRAWLFNNLTEEERKQIIDDLQEISDEHERLFDEFFEEREFELAAALEGAIEKHGYHHVLAALETGELPDVCAGSVHRDLAPIFVEDFEKTLGWELDPIEEMKTEDESAAEAFGGRFDGQGNYIPEAGANC